MPLALRIISLVVLSIPFLADASPRTVTVARTQDAPRVDGFLQDPAWEFAPPTSDFVQQRPQTGEPSTARTIVRLLFDDEALYVGFECTEPEGAVLARSLSRDSHFDDEDAFTIVLDTYDDSQNSFVFSVNPNGARRDLLVRNEGEYQNEDWDGIWSTRTRITTDGWQGEVRIPWQTLRFPRRDVIRMGVNFERQRRAVNEQSHWAAVPREFDVYRVSLAGTLVGLRDIDPGRNVIVRPYALGRVERGQVDVPGSYAADDWDEDAEIGLDVKVGLTPSITLDLTVNTDFAEVEIDDEILNVTRFDVDLPEKREFFLEQADLFRFGSPQNLLFRSRSIGIDDAGRTYPIHYGARLTGREGRTEFGVLGIEQGDAFGAPTRRFGVMRVRHDVTPRSSVGVLALTRQASDDGDVPEADHYAYGIDADLNPTDRLLLSIYASRTDFDGPGADARGADDASVGGRVRWTHPNVTLTYFFEGIGRDFAPVAGFLERAPGVNVNVAGAYFFAEPNTRFVRRTGMETALLWYDRRSGPFESRYIYVAPEIYGPSEERLSVFWERDFDRLFGPFPLGDVVFAPGDYTYDYLGWSASTDPSQWWSLSGSGILGNFFDADRTNVQLGFDLNVAPHFSFGVQTISERIRRGDDAFRSDLWRLRTRYAVNTQLSVDLFAQYNERARLAVSQLRLRWIFGDESDLFVVLNDGRDANLTTGVERVRWDFGDRRRTDLTVKVSYARAL